MELKQQIKVILDSNIEEDTKVDLIIYMCEKHCNTKEYIWIPYVNPYTLPQQPYINPYNPIIY